MHFTPVYRAFAPADSAADKLWYFIVTRNLENGIKYDANAKKAGLSESGFGSF